MFQRLKSLAIVLVLSSLPLGLVADPGDSPPQASQAQDAEANLAATSQRATEVVQTTALEEAARLLTQRSFNDKEAAVRQLADSTDPAALVLLNQLLAGDLQYRKDDGRLVLATKTDAGFRLTDALSGADLGVVGSRDVKKITINNRMRTSLRTAIATLTLASPDTATRREAAQQLLGTQDPDALARMREQLAQESDGQVKELLGLAVALADLESDEIATRQAAIASLADSLQPDARNALNSLVLSESDPETLSLAQQALADIDRKVELNAMVETLFFGLSLGSVLALAAIGLAITFGVMGVINMAHGELIMIGAYTTYIVQLLMPNAIDYSLFVAIPAAFLVAGAVGVLIERGVIRFLYGRPLETLLATFGISLILQQLVRTTISAQNVIVENPTWMSGALSINPVLSLTYNRLYILIFALLVFVALLLVMKKTALGLQVRAVSQNRAMARAMGVRSARVDALTFGLGAGIAGVAGVALSQLTNVGPNMGQAYIIDSFMVVVFGGVGNLWGTLVAGMTLGVANKFMEPWTGAVLAKILVLVFIILFIQKRPRGLFPQRGRAAEG